MTSEAAGASRDVSSNPAQDGSVGASSLADEERLRSLIRAELERKYAAKVAHRTLSLLAEAAVEPTGEEPGYRIVDRNGDTRYRQGAEPGSNMGAMPMTLGDLVDELRQRYPDLFLKPPEPPPQPVPAAPPEQDTMAEMRAAGTRFVEHQTALARSFASTSAERGRSLASRFGSWRSRIEDGRKTEPDEKPRLDDEAAAQVAAEPV